MSPAGVMNRDAAAGYVLREGKFVVQELYWQCLGHSGAAGVRARAGVKSSWARLVWAAGRLSLSGGQGCRRGGCRDLHFLKVCLFLVLFYIFRYFMAFMLLSIETG